MTRAGPRSLFDKLWDAHAIADLGDGSWLLQIDRVLLHDVNGGPALRGLGEAGRAAASPDQVFAVVDHGISTVPGTGPRTTWTIVGGQMIGATRELARQHGIRMIDCDDPRQGISNVIAAELGIALPGLTVVCGDSHTCTLGGIGALAWGIGTSEVTHALATQTLVQTRPLSMRVSFEGRLPDGVTAKDMVLALIARHGVGAGGGCAVEFAGSAVRDLSLEARLTLCNMAIEFSAKYGFVAPDQKTIAYLQDAEYAPRGAAWARAVDSWRALAGDAGATFDCEITIDVSDLEPQVTWGTTPQHSVSVAGRVPAPDTAADARASALAERALAYQQLAPGTRMQDVRIDVAYIGSCSNARLSDLREAASVLRDKTIAPHVTGICVPGSSAVKRAAEAEGLDAVFRAAGFEWHDAGCAMCGHGRDRLRDVRIISTTNRNFENRQGRLTRTHLASPTTVAASAVAGHICDPRSVR